MYNISEAITALKGLVGWQQPINPAMPVIDSDNKISTSGLCFDENPLVKIEAIKETQDYADISDEQFNNVLESINERAIKIVCKNVFDKSDFIDRQRLHTGRIKFNETTTFKPGFNGYKFVITENNVAFEITDLFLTFQNSGTLKLLLFDASKTELIDSKTIEVSGGTTERTALNWIIRERGTYYIGYIAGDLIPYDRMYGKNNIQNVCINQVRSDTTTETIPMDIVGDSTCNGVNFDIFVHKDFTELIKDNARMFASAIQIAGQIEVLNQYLTSIRLNRVQRAAKGLADEILVNINGFSSDTVKIKGLSQYYYGEIQSIKKEIDKLNKGYFAHGFICNIQQ